MGLNAKLGHPYRGSGHGRERGEYRAVVKGQARKARRAEDAKATEAEAAELRSLQAPLDRQGLPVDTAAGEFSPELSSSAGSAVTAQSCGR